MSPRVSGVVVGVSLALAGLLGFTRLDPSAGGRFTAVVQNTQNTAASSITPCRTAALAPGTASFVYTLAEPTGATTAVDVSGNNRNGTYSSTGVTGTTGGPCTLDGGRAVALDGTTGAVTGPSFVLGLLSFSEAVWFRTTTGGGLLMGVGNAASGDSLLHDRALYLSNNGAVNFEVKPVLGPAVITSPATYKDGAWHLAVATFSATGGMVLYVDGAQVAANAGVTTALALGATSYWRIGYDSLSGVGTSAPTNTHFTGSLAFASAYTGVLTPAQVAALYAARS